MQGVVKLLRLNCHSEQGKESLPHYFLIGQGSLVASLLGMTEKTNVPELLPRSFGLLVGVITGAHQRA